MATQQEIDQIKEQMGKCGEEITQISKTLSPFDRGWIDLPESYVEDLRRRLRECEAEFERLRAELEQAGPYGT